jgi:hypothetical protein
MTESLKPHRTKIHLEIDLKYIEQLFLSLVGDHLVKHDEIFTDDFLLRHTKFRSFQEMLNAAGVTEDEIETRTFRTFIFRNTKFFDYEDMCKIASAEYFIKKLAFSMPNRQLTQ